MSDDQGAEPVLPPSWIGEASDHEQTTLKTLDLPPAVASPRLIRQVTPLGDDLPRHPSGMPGRRPAAAAIDVLGVADAPCLRGPSSLSKRAFRASSGNRSSARLPEQVSRTRSKRGPGAGTAGDGSCIASKLLRRWEASPPARHRSARPSLRARERLQRFRKFRRPVQSPSTDEPDTTIGDEAADAISVELDLVHPFVARRRCLRQRGEVGTYSAGAIDRRRSRQRSRGTSG